MNRPEAIDCAELMILIRYRLLVCALIDGDVNDAELGFLDESIAKEGYLVWIQDGADEQSDGGVRQPVISEERLSETELSSVIEDGFLHLSRNAECRKMALRSIAALLLDVDRFEKFVVMLYERGLPAWTQSRNADELSETMRKSFAESLIAGRSFEQAANELIARTDRLGPRSIDQPIQNRGGDDPTYAP